MRRNRHHLILPWLALAVLVCTGPAVALRATSEATEAESRRLGSSVTLDFTPESARLSNISKAKLHEVALRMKQDPELRARALGHAERSESGIRRLAEARASAVVNYLVTRHGIDPARIIASGASSDDPGRITVVSLTEE